jgi:hypothetical protein
VNVDGDDSDEDELEQSAATAPGAMHPLLTVQAPAAAQVPVTAQVPAAPQVPVAHLLTVQAPAGCPVPGTRNPVLQYLFPMRGPQTKTASRRIAALRAGGQGETVGGIKGIRESSTKRVASHTEGKARAAHAQEQVNAASDSVSKCQRRRQRTKRRGASSCSVKHLSESKCPAASASSSALRPQSQKVVPTSVAEARTLPDSARWQEAIESEVGSMVKYGVWEHADLPPGKQALPSFFISDLKRDGRYKAQLVAGGHRQREGLDVEETFAQCTRITLCACCLRWRHMKVWSFASLTSARLF